MAMLFDDLGRATVGARLGQRALAQLYLGLGAFVATSIALGVVTFTRLAAGGCLVAFYSRRRCARTSSDVPYHLYCSLRDDDRRGVRVAARYGRHDRRVGLTEVCRAVDTERRIDDGLGMDAHGAGADGCQ